MRTIHGLNHFETEKSNNGNLQFPRWHRKRQRSECLKSQNEELDIQDSEIKTKFTFRNKKKITNLVIEVNSETRKKFLQRKLKIGWLICSMEDYLVARYFRWSRMGHRHQDCKETCPPCAGEHKLSECTAIEGKYKCINCMVYNNYSNKEKICENHSSLNKNCPSLITVLRKYRQNTNYWIWLHNLNIE